MKKIKNSDRESINNCVVKEIQIYYNVKKRLVGVFKKSEEQDNATETGLKERGVLEIENLQPYTRCFSNFAIMYYFTL